MGAGQPPKYATPEALQKKIDEIIAKYEKDGYNINMTLLTAELGFGGRTSIYDYMNRNEQFSNIIKNVKTKIAGLKIMKAESNELNATMAIFDLKCNHNFNDKASQENEKSVNVVGFEFRPIKGDD